MVSGMAISADRTLFLLCLPMRTLYIVFHNSHMALTTELRNVFFFRRSNKTRLWVHCVHILYLGIATMAVVAGDNVFFMNAFMPKLYRLGPNPPPIFIT